jgi:hypothetical protein
MTKVFPPLGQESPQRSPPNQLASTNCVWFYDRSGVHVARNAPRRPIPHLTAQIVRSRLSPAPASPASDSLASPWFLLQNLANPIYTEAPASSFRLFPLLSHTSLFFPRPPDPTSVAAGGEWGGRHPPPPPARQHLLLCSPSLSSLSLPFPCEATAAMMRWRPCRTTSPLQVAHRCG